MYDLMCHDGQQPPWLPARFPDVRKRASPMQPWLMLALAIASELIGETALKSAGGFKKIVPSIIVFVCFVLSYVFLSLSIKVVPLSIAYAVWSGIGVFATAVIGTLLFREILTWPRMAGMALVIVGTVLLNLFTRGGA